MGRVRFCRGAAAICAGFFCLSSVPVWGKSAKDVFAQAAQAVVVVLALDSQGQTIAQGSGVVVGKNEVATNCHVVDNAQEIIVRQAADSGAEKTYRMTARIVAHNDVRDLCLLFVDELSHSPAAPAAEMGAAKKLAVGEEVFAIGAPNGLELSISRGIVSQLRKIDKYGDAPLVQTDAAISSGSSGGGLFDENGELVGITAFKWQGENLNFALPVEWIWEIYVELRRARELLNEARKRGESSSDDAQVGETEQRLIRGVVEGEGMPDTTNALSPNPTRKPTAEFTPEDDEAQYQGAVNAENAVHQMVIGSEPKNFQILDRAGDPVRKFDAKLDGSWVYLLNQKGYPEYSAKVAVSADGKKVNIYGLDSEGDIGRGPERAAHLVSGGRGILASGARFFGADDLAESLEVGVGDVEREEGLVRLRAQMGFSDAPHVGDLNALEKILIWILIAACVYYIFGRLRG